MLISSEVVLKNLVIHKITSEGLIPSTRAITLKDEGLNNLLVNYFFKTFKEEELWQFASESGLDDLGIYQMAKQIFENPSSIYDISLQMGDHLSDQSNHHNIKEGDLFVCYFEDCVINDEITDAIGLFKVENKDTYLKIMGNENIFEISSDEGININKLDKGALIFNTDQDDGYRCLVIDNTNRSSHGQYWQRDFLALEKITDDYYHTQNLINSVQEFAQVAFQDKEASDKISLVNESIQYVKDNDFFVKDDFQEKILKSPELIDEFEQFQERKIEDNPEFANDNFGISKPAVKNTKRFIRSVIKLDKNFHLYVHGNKELIEKGFDPEKKKNFYTLYFDEEC